MDSATTIVNKADQTGGDTPSILAIGEAHIEAGISVIPLAVSARPPIGGLAEDQAIRCQVG